MSVTIGDIVNWVESPSPNQSETVDQLLFGSRKQPVKKVAVSFSPSVETIKRAKGIGANLLICHESIYYDHQEPHLHKTKLVMREKLELVKKFDLAIYRNHDSVHRQNPDLITAGLVHELNWENYIVENDAIQISIQIPETSLEAILIHIQNTLKLKYVRYVGKKSNIINSVSLLAGFRGSGADVIPLLEQNELVIYGEGPEWEAPEYVKDALALGFNKNIIILGHMESEEPGMKRFARELEKRFPEITSEFIPANPFINLYDEG